MAVITRLLENTNVLDGYRKISILYPEVPPMIIWRGWEFAAYRNFTIIEPAVDIGCGDGIFFRTLWPNITDVDGVDHDPHGIDAAKRSGVYRETFLATAQKMPLGDNRYSTAFANCSLEHMDDLPTVLREIHRCLKPGGQFLFSVITDKWLAWNVMPMLSEILGKGLPSKELLASYIGYHHHVNIMTPPEWEKKLEMAGFSLEEHVPIVPEITGRLFLFLDHLWHLKYQGNEIGHMLPAAFNEWRSFRESFLTVLAGLLSAENDLQTGCGAVYLARKQ